MITILLEQIIELIKGWISAFSDHAQHVEDKLDSIDSTASDIKDNTDSLPDIEDNTAAVITPINNIKTNTDSIASSNTTIANNTTAISNQVSAMSTNVGRAAAYAEDCANNSLNILDKVTTIASDTTQIRTDTGNMSLEQSKIYDAVKWLLADKTIEETEEGQDSVTFNTDIADDLTGLTVGLVATQSGTGDPSPDNVRAFNGYSNIGLTVNGNAVSISLGNTYYIGEADLVNGALTVTHALFNQYNLMTPGNNNNSNTGTIFYRDITALNFENSPETKCSVMKGRSVSGWENLEINEFLITTGYFIFCVPGTSLTLANMLQWVNDNNCEFLMKLKTPIIISLTPQQIAAIKGDNTIATDTNGKVTVTYTESIKHYLDKQDNA